MVVFSAAARCAFNVYIFVRAKEAGRVHNTRLMQPDEDARHRDGVFQWSGKNVVVRDSLAGVSVAVGCHDSISASAATHESLAILSMLCYIVAAVWHWQAFVWRLIPDASVYHSCAPRLYARRNGRGEVYLRRAISSRARSC